jgi:hypothetical protein
MHRNSVAWIEIGIQHCQGVLSVLISNKNIVSGNFHSHTVHLDIIRVFYYLPTDAQENCFKKNIKIYIKIAPTCFGAITIIRERIIRAC